MKPIFCSRFGCSSVILAVAGMVACGGSSGGSGSHPPPPPPALTITDNSILPGTLQNHAYTFTLHAINGVGALKWSIAPVSSTALFVDGLTMDPGTGVLSGTVNFAGTAGFVATVSDSSSPSHTTHKSFTVTAYLPLQSPPPQTFTVGEFQDVFGAQIAALNGVEPLSFALTGGTLPPGMRVDSQTGQLRGSAIRTGSFVSTVAITDSFSPPEVVSAQVTVGVVAPPLQVASSLPSNVLRNRPFSGRVVAIGGVPPYKFTVGSGSFPTGFNPIELNTGNVSGTPSTLGNYFVTINVSDSSNPPQLSSNSYSISVGDPIGRNDTPATATALSQDGFYYGSISPYIDPPDNAPLVADNDYYKLVSIAGSTVHVETQAQRWYTGDALDTVIEVVDGNGTRLSTCRLPGSTATTFTSACIDDDIPGSLGTLDSALDFKVPGAPSTTTTFYVHVIDWRGDARPDMAYVLQINGVVPPLSIFTTSLAPGNRTIPYTQYLVAQNSSGSVTWTMAGGNLPPGLNLAANGTISGTPTSNGTYPFTVQASDGSNPPQTATAQESIQIVDAVKITSAATWPDACVNQPYSLTLHTSGGLAPYYWTFFASPWMGIDLNQTTGVFSGTPFATGTFTGSLGVNDATGNSASQNITVTVKQCP